MVIELRTQRQTTLGAKGIEHEGCKPEGERPQQTEDEKAAAAAAAESVENHLGAWGVPGLVNTLGAYYIGEGMGKEFIADMYASWELPYPSESEEYAPVYICGGAVRFECAPDVE